MSKCRPDCCPSSSGDGSGIAIIGFIVLVAGAYEIIRAIVRAVEAIMRVLIEIVEITAITAGSIAVLTVLAFIVIRLSRRHFRQSADPAGLKVTRITLDPAVPPIVASIGLGKPSRDAAELFAEAVASPAMDSRFIESILRNAMNGPDQ